MEEDLLFTNVFLPDIQTNDVNDDRARSFRTYMVDKKRNAQEKSVIKSIETPNFNKDSFSVFDKTLPAISPWNNFKYEKKSIVSLDTGDRDKNKYPSPNDFKMFLGKKFLNVKQVALISTEFPNTDQVIKNTPPQLQNNTIYWSNKEDIDLGLYFNVIIQTTIHNYVSLIIQNHGLSSDTIIYVSNSTSNPSINGYRKITVVDQNSLQFYFKGGIQMQASAKVDTGIPNYVVYVVPGNYTSDSLVAEISKETNLIKRRNGLGDFHYFQISVVNQTDVVTFNSLILTQLPNNSLASQVGTGYITVNQKNHGYTNNQLITIIGARFFSGIAAMTLNGQFFINVIDNNSFSYEVNVNAIDSSSGGGNTIRTGKGAPIRLLFDSPSNTIQPKMGFPKEDSSEPIGSIDPFTTKTVSILSVSIGDETTITTTVPHGLTSAIVINILSIAVGKSTIITTVVPHLVTIPTRISIVHSNSRPSVDGHWLLTPLSPTTFSIDVNVIFPGSQGLVKYGGDSVRIAGLSTIPNLLGINGLTSQPFYVENATPDTFEIDFSTNFVDMSTMLSAVVETSIVSVNHPAHGFNSVMSIISDPTNSQKAIITTQLSHNLIGNLILNLSVTTVIGNTIDITYVRHGLLTGALIYLSDSVTTPSIDGSYYVTVIDFQTLRINFIGGIIGVGTVTVATGNKVTLSLTNSIPSIDGTYNVEVIDAMNFKIQTVFSILTAGNNGILGRKNEVVFYRSVSNVAGTDNIAGIPLMNLNGVYRKIISVTDIDNYLIRVEDQYATTTTTAGGKNVRVSSEKHGYSDFQSNTVDGKTSGSLYRSISLEGENYVFMVSEDLPTSLFNSSGVDHAFAKILLSEPPGNLLFNTFLSSPSVFDSPVSSLSEIHFQIFQKNGYLYNFNDIEFSFSLEITEFIDSLAATNLSSKNVDQLEFSSRPKSIQTSANRKIFG